MLLDLLFPRRCPVCFGIISKKDSVSAGLCCKSCYPHIRFIKSPTCFICGREVKEIREEFCEECKKSKRNFKRGVALLDYADPFSARLMWKFKYENGKEYGLFLARELLLRYGNLLKSFHIDCVIPVPVHKSKLRQRGYNQAEVIARNIALGLSLPMDNKVLIRVKKTMAQKELTKQERYENLLRAFVATKRAGRYKNVLLVDDIFTTGATAYVCTKMLKSMGVENVYLACVCIGRTEESASENFR